MDTIATISTPLASGAIGVVRMSGDAAASIAGQMFRTRSLGDFAAAEPNRMYYGTIETRTVKDGALAVLFRAPHSYTGEDVVEFQCHGGVRLVEEILKECLARGARLADKGEFTKRAFLNGKIKLSDAEGIADMINAESVAAINAGYRLARGGVARRVDAQAQALLDVIGEMEASLDYPDEMEDESLSDCAAYLDRAIVDLKELEDSARLGGYVKKGIAVAIVGQANVGKSSLLNRLLGRERAIVTEIAGTTRDTLEEALEVDGVTLNLIDTAGIRESDDAIERMGVERSRRAAESSDAVLFVSVADRPYNDEEIKMLDALETQTHAIVLRVVNKCDLGIDPSHAGAIAISAKQNIGVDALKRRVVECVTGGKIDPSADLITNERHLQAIRRALEALESARAALGSVPTECVALDLRAAYFALGEITGQSATEEIVDRIFSKFCLGK